MPDPVTSTIVSYYDSLETRIGYRLFLGGTRHFGYYESERSWPWPISPALRAMEEKMYQALGCDKGSKILDAGCGVGHVALYMAERGGFQVEAIDLTPHHVEKAANNIKAAGMGSSVSVRQGDYHNLEAFDGADFDGVYTMETFVHAAEPREVMRGFLRLLKPGGRLVMHEYDHVTLEQVPKQILDEGRALNEKVGMPSFEAWGIEGLGELAREVGFRHVEVTNLSRHIVPMLWLFYIYAYIPYLVLKLFGIEYYFPNTTAGVKFYRGRKFWRYVQVTAFK